ncbi:MAG: hypothetical protein E7253_07515 [Lachnospiraceae bacterium]|nr:hypothetical protein [Lachnospiraceae bacterium]
MFWWIIATCAALTSLVILGNIPGAFFLKNADTGIIKVILGFIIIYLSVEMYLNEKRKIDNRMRNHLVLREHSHFCEFEL